jgi:hypothetical protein
MPSKEELRAVLRDRLDETISTVNAALRGKGLKRIEKVLERIGRGGRLPDWYEKLKSDRVLPNLGGKTIDSVIEILLLGVLEQQTFAEIPGAPQLRINPARGVDLPDLDLDVKLPSENFCTSEPSFSAYEPLLGTEHDVLVLLTDYQRAKENPPLRLQIIDWKYLGKTQIADENLCRIARKHREWLLSTNESWAKKIFRFLSFVNQSDWRAKRLVALVDHLREPDAIRREITAAELDFPIEEPAACKAGSFADTRDRS